MTETNSLFFKYILYYIKEVAHYSYIWKIFNYKKELEDFANAFLAFTEMITFVNNIDIFA